MAGMSSAFLYVETPSLLAGLRAVEDTALLRERFCDNSQNKKMTKPEALPQAQLGLKPVPERQRPYFWAAFELIGDWRNRKGPLFAPLRKPVQLRYHLNIGL